MGTAGWVRGGRFDRSRVKPLLDGRDRQGLVGTSWGDCWGDSIVVCLVVVVVFVG